MCLTGVDARPLSKTICSVRLTRCQMLRTGNEIQQENEMRSGESKSSKSSPSSEKSYMASPGRRDSVYSELVKFNDFGHLIEQAINVSLRV